MTVQGVDRLLSKLEAMQDGGPKVVATAVTSSANNVANEAKSIVPRRTSNLMRSIHPDDLEVSDDKVTVDVGTDVEYAVYVERGTSRTEARPYMQPALDKSRPVVQRDVSRAIRAIVRAQSIGG